MPVTFQKAGLSDLTIETGRSFPIKEDIAFNQEINLTEDRQPKVVDYGGDPESFIEVNINPISVKEYNDLKAWFISSQVNGSANTFTMIDEEGTTKTVRLWDRKVSLSKEAFGVYSTSFLLREE